MTNNDSSLTKTVTDAISYCSSVAGMAGMVNAGVYVLPTMLSLMKNISSEELESIRNGKSDLEKKTENQGKILGVGLIFLQFAGYCSAAMMGHPEYLFIPIATNYGSHLFEKSVEKN